MANSKGSQAGKQAKLSAVRAHIDALLPLALETLEAVLRYRPPDDPGNAAAEAVLQANRRTMAVTAPPPSPPPSPPPQTIEQRLEAALELTPPAPSPALQTAQPAQITPHTRMPLTEQINVARMVLKEFGKAGQLPVNLPGYAELRPEQKLDYLDMAVGSGQMELDTYRFLTGVVKDQSQIINAVEMQAFIDRILSGEPLTEVVKDFQARGGYLQ
jgi:hypothetical protein